MLYFVRHGSTALNAGDPADPKDYFRGWIDEPLSESGKLEGQQTAEWFRGKNVDLLVSSPLNRARTTMEMVYKTTKEPNWRLDTRLLPWHIGVFTGQEMTEQNMAVLGDMAAAQPWMAPPMGEPYMTFLERYTKGFKEWLEKSKDMDIVLFAHHRNALAVPVIMKGAVPSMHGPPHPGGVISISQQGAIRELFTPPEALRILKLQETGGSGS